MDAALGEHKGAPAGLGRDRGEGMEVLGVNLAGLITQLISFGILGGILFALFYALFFKRR